jgi:hypothetical protein
MSQWLVTADDSQFSVDGVGELKQLATEGKVRASDMVQRPGSSEWVYAGELTELSGLFSDSSPPDSDEFELKKSSSSGTIIAGILIVIALIGGGAIFTMAPKLDDGGKGIFDELSYSEMLVTEMGAPVHKEADAGSPVVANLAKDEKVALLAKRGKFYRTRTSAGQEGWIASNKVIPGYLLAGIEVRAELDPLYNPDRYVEIANSSWIQLPDQREDKITVFQFHLRNRAQYVMTDLVLLATVKDAKGSVLEKLEIPIEGDIPSDGSTWVGTLGAEEKTEPSRSMTKYTLNEMAEDDPELQLRYSDGVEVIMTSEEFTDATIDILELRAKPRS